jgi:trans-aconitate methyltransferase
MADLTASQLEQPEQVPPYVAFRELLAHLAADSALPQPARFLDIGAGAGAYGELLERWWPGRFDYVGADYSEEILAVARGRWPGRTFVQKDLFEAGALDGYDVVFASALLDVLAEIDRALDAFLAADARWAVLHRQRIDPRRSHVEVTSGYRGQRTYSSYVTRAQLAEAAERHGRRIVHEVQVDGDVHSFVLERR